MAVLNTSCIDVFSVFGYDCIILAIMCFVCAKVFFNKSRYIVQDNAIYVKTYKNGENIIKYLPKLQQYCMISNIDKIEKIESLPQNILK